MLIAGPLILFNIDIGHVDEGGHRFAFLGMVNQLEAAAVIAFIGR